MANDSAIATLTAAGPTNIGGGILRGPLGTVIPTDARSELDEALKKMGVVSDEGLAPTGERESEKKNEWGGDVVANLQTSHSSTFEFTLWSVFDLEALSAVFGGANVEMTPATTEAGTLYTVKETGDELDHAMWVFDMRYLKKKMRFIVPDGQPSAIEELALVKNDLNGFKITLEAFKDDESGSKVIRYYDDGVFATSSGGE